MSSSPTSAIETSFAPARRADLPEVQRQRGEFLGVSVGLSMLEAMPGPALVINEDRQILCVNSMLLAMLSIQDVMPLLGQRPGEAVGCVNAGQGPGGCGTTTACSHCGAVGAIIEALETGGRATRECRIVVNRPTGRVSLDLRVHANYLEVDGERYVILGLEDIGDEKRRQVLERAFFHDLLNTCGGVQGLAELLVDLQDDPETEAACKRDLVQLSRLVVEEIRTHQQMLAAERGELEPELEEIDTEAFLQELVTLYRNHIVRGGQQIQLEAADGDRLRTDASLLRRVLGNLLKNAIEATTDDATITLSVRALPNAVVFAVHNPGVISPEVQLQLFQRSFSTKDGSGRGIGTYAARLFTERYLRGTVTFASDEAVGTVFSVTLPRD